MLTIKFSKNLSVKKRRMWKIFINMSYVLYRITLYDWIEIAFLGFRGFFQEREVGKKHGKTYGNGDYNDVRFYWFSPTSSACTFHTCSHTWTYARAQSLSFSIRAADIRFHEGHIPCNQTLGPNGFRRVHIVVAVVILTAVSRSRRSNERDALPRCVSKFHDCYNEMPEIFVWKAICCRKSCRKSALFFTAHVSYLSFRKMY